MKIVVQRVKNASVKVERNDNWRNKKWTFSILRNNTYRH